MKKIVQCVPNFSEGRNQETIDAIARAISETPGCTLLDVNPGASTNRTVITFVGGPESIVEGALNAAREAHARIDMSRHEGEHPRFGALDVCPFVPVANTTMEECVAIAEAFGRRLAEELNVPVYLYENAARQDYRRTLPDIRRGEYEGLPKKLRDPAWKPDFGPAAFVPSWGATATGARMFLIAYNVNILGTSNQAHRIALNLREAGRGEKQPGRLKAVKGMGWFVGEYNMAQVTVNLTDYTVTPLHVLFEEVKKDAAELSVGVAGSEIVGLIPLEALLMAADFYMKKENLFLYEEDQKVRLAIDRLGLNSVAPFKPAERIIEYVVREKPVEPLASLTLRGFIEDVASRSSAPGGGSVSAQMAAVGAGLGAMVAKLTYGVKKFEKVDGQMRSIIPRLHAVTQKLIPMIDADTNAFADYVEALRMPRDSDENKAARKRAIQVGLKTAVEVPLSTMRIGDEAWDAMIDAATFGNIASKSDVQVGARALEVGIWGAWQNVLINLVDIEDQSYKAGILEQSGKLAERANTKCAQVLDILEKRST
ncbi:MAG: glutamate formimidoyltransferase [Syntrophobacteraceae bacterium]